MTKEYWWNDKLQGKIEVRVVKKPPKCHSVPQKLCVDYLEARSEASAVGGQQLGV
jgi:hypothetical protein